MEVGGLSIKRTQLDRLIRINLKGELDLAVAADLRSELLHYEDELRTGDVEEIVVDTTQLEFIDSAGLGALVAARDRLGEYLALVPGRMTRRLLHISGTARHFGLEP